VQRGHAGVVSQPLSLRLPPVPESVRLARTTMTAFCLRHGLCHDLTDRVRLAVSEACTTIVLHARREDDADSTLALEAVLEDETLVVVVHDSRSVAGVDGDSLSHDELGIGMRIMARAATSADMTSRLGLGTRIALRFDTSSASS
jgi:serine/threonine-protein kinase RsbW